MKAERPYPAYTVTPKAEAAILKGHPWVYADEITAAPDPAPENGAVVDVLSRKAFTGSGAQRREIPIPEDMLEEVNAAIEACREAAASTAEDLMEKYFEEGELTDEEMLRGLSAGIHKRI